MIRHHEVAALGSPVAALEFECLVHHGVIGRYGFSIAGEQAAILVIGNEKLIVLERRFELQSNVVNVMTELGDFSRVRLRQTLPEAVSVRRKRGGGPVEHQQ